MPTKQPDSGKTSPKRKAAGTRQKASTKPRNPGGRPPKGTPPDTYHGIHLDHYIDRISSGDSVAKIADELGVGRHALHVWLAHETRIDRYLAAQTDSADSLMDKAEKAILDENLDVARARELANHYRHVAKARNPRRWGDRQQIEMSGELGIRELSDDQINAKLDRLMSINNVGTSD